MEKYPGYRIGICTKLREQTLLCFLIGFLIFLFKFCTQAFMQLEFTNDMGFFEPKDSVFQTIPEVF